MAGSGLGLGQLARAIRMARAVRFRKGGGGLGVANQAWQKHVILVIQRDLFGMVK